ncbi:uncharacterized protein KY384_007629 [Bacidia gigantensis]|uniref:uncharacterized protein n=1 Tax=Bacidia gigantensis TaxID=2732470 RepID=UPI001D0462CE|nr:uncharacterized protein KY384_007629 [Bacidia gigantensis]KAG8527477.1 hypothetical protein KY384_007629 [Bacidia gigantensis]
MLSRGRILELPKSIISQHRSRSSVSQLHKDGVRERWRGSDQRSQLSVKPTLGSAVRLNRGEQALDATTRKKTLSDGLFATWLSDWLDVLAQSVTDKGFAQYLKQFKINLRLHKVYRQKLGDHVVGTGSALLRQPTGSQDPQKLYKALGALYLVDGERAVNAQLRYTYSIIDNNRQSSTITLEDQERLADLRYPAEWYPDTRCIQRTIHLHVGPTNSGKTYRALKRLEQAESGVYAGPLRLLAHEVFGRLNAQGKSCDLLTGDERITVAEDGQPAKMQSCTVEMLPLHTDFDVAVIDEIQMLGHDQRGWAWTQALLGLKARELHLCGEERTVPLIRELAASMGDKIEVHTYKRLSPLKTMSSSLRGDLASLRKGDCVVVFSRMGLHAMRRDIEKATQRRVAIVYGSLPPEVRAQQARLFNDPDNDYDFLVASDAIGMGLNLAIKRIVFESVHKSNGFTNELMESAQIKQIAGRAGRFRVALGAENETEVSNPKDLPAPNVGLVTTLENHDMVYVRRAMQAEPDPIMSAGLFPPTDIIEQFAAYFDPSTRFSHIMQRLHEIALVQPRYKLCHLRDQVRIADIIHSVENLSLRDRITFCAAPAQVGGQGGTKRIGGMPEIVRAFARCVGDRSSGALLEISELNIDVLNEKMTVDRGYLDRLEMLHKALVLYLWLSYRFPGAFISQGMGFYLKGLVENRIDKTLSEFSATSAIQKRIKMMRKKAEQNIKRLGETTANEDNVLLHQGAGAVDDEILPSASKEPLDHSVIPSDIEALTPPWPHQNNPKMPQAPEIVNAKLSRSFTNLCL